MSDSSPPSSDAIKETTEKVATFVKWIAELIRSRNWFTLLLLVDVGLILFLTPGGIIAKFLKEMFSLELPPQYASGFWLVVGLVFVAALGVAVRTMPAAAKAADTKERKAIKGLRPFTAADAEIFAQLQRNRDVQICLDAVTNTDFRFGILMGESGCGKTSFLQAGVIPRLSQPDGSHRGVYVRFSDRAPIDTIRAALAEQISPTPLEKAGSTQVPPFPRGAEGGSPDFHSLLTRAAEVAGKPLILLFDQFEQFFVHQKRKEDREPFIQALNEWYQSALPVKILVCIRGDLSDRLVELQHALGYSLGPQEVFRLERFTPREATAVLKVIADSEALQFDERFVTELTENELANREDGSISPVDLQILSWMIERQNTTEQRAFNRLAFQKLGGVEGLLTRFLEKTLDARVIKSQRETAVKVLLALTDLERNVRAGTLTLPELQEKLQGSLSPAEIREATTWLCRSDVRLVTPTEREDTTGYELAHERLIPALIRLAGSELSQANRANQLLDRRVNEWLGNQRNSRYLFGWRELWLLKQQEPYLIWGANRRQKEQLLKRSKLSLYRWLSIAVATLTALTFLVGWWFSPWGQIQQIRWELEELSAQVNDYEAVDAVVALTKDGSLKQANSILMNKIEDSSTKALASAKMADVHLIFGSPTQAKQKLTEALDSIKSSKSSENRYALNGVSMRARAFSAIAEVVEELRNTTQARQVLIKLLPLVETLTSTSDRAWAFNAISRAYEKVGDAAQARRLLDKTLILIKAIPDEMGRAEVIQAVARSGGKSAKIAQGKQILVEALTLSRAIDDASYKFSPSESIAEAAGQLANAAQTRQELIEILNFVNAIEGIEDTKRAEVFSAIAKRAGKLTKATQARELLVDMLKVARKLDAPHAKAQVLGSITETYGKLRETAQSKKILIEILNLAKTTNDTYSKVRILTTVAETYEELGDSAQAKRMLTEASKLIKEIDDVPVVENIINVYKQLGDASQARQNLQQVLDDLEIGNEAIENFFDARTQQLVKAYADLGNWRQARQIAQELEASYEIRALSEVLTVWAEQRNPRLREVGSGE